MTYDVTMTSLLKTLGKFGPTRQIIHYSNGNDESFPKM